MAKQDNWKDTFSKMVFTTGDSTDFQEEDAVPEEQMLPAGQKLRLCLDKKKRRGKAVTLIKGFNGDEVSVKELAGELKKVCGVGGSVKAYEILIQGDQRQKLLTYLLKKGYKNTKIAGG